jgi:predicted transcriptional regulator
MALADYTALALLMPYGATLEAARTLGYDPDRLALRFDVGFETVCRRLVTLQQPTARGIPFYLVAVDLAGNVSARFSAAPVRIARYSGVCPLWNAHAAFLTPGLARVQLSRMPDGTAYLSIARTVERPDWGPARQQRLVSLELGCETAYAGELAYGRGLDLDSEAAAVPVGTTCRLCERTDCAQRALPPVSGRLALDENRRLPGAAGAW